MKHEVKRSALLSGSHATICPFCGADELCPADGIQVPCDLCSRAVEGAVLRTLERITALPDALGKHACECGHPEMRRLPDGVFRCSACGSEVVPLEAISIHTVLVGKEKML